MISVDRLQNTRAPAQVHDALGGDTRVYSAQARPSRAQRTCRSSDRAGDLACVITAAAYASRSEPARASKIDSLKLWRQSQGGISAMENPARRRAPTSLSKSNHDTIARRPRAGGGCAVWSWGRAVLRTVTEVVNRGQLRCAYMK